MVAMELEVIVQYARLPEGFKFHDWGGGNCAVAVLDSSGRKYLDLLECAIERISDGALETIRITSFKPTTRGIISLCIAPFISEVEKAIQKLS